MPRCRHYTVLVWTVLLFAASFSKTLAGVTGSLSGYIYDAQNNKAIAGVSVILEGTEYGTTTDKYGFYSINGISPGSYDVRTQMIGYTKMRITEVIIKTDINTRLDFPLLLEVLQARPDPEVVITAERMPERNEVTSTSYYINKSELTSQLPVDGYLDSFKYKPGIVGTHFRGGRQKDVIYLLDGIPIISALTREIAYNIPNSAISELVLMTGGFGAEFDNGTAGVVNIVSKRGRNQFSSTAKMYTDYIGFPSDAYDNLKRAELGFGGPLSLNFGGPTIDMNYYMSADFNLSDSPFRTELRQHFSGPIQKNFNGTAVYDIRITRNINLAFQALLSQWRWRSLDDEYKTDVNGLPTHKNRRVRTTMRLTHTVSPSFLYYITSGFSRMRDEVFGDSSSDLAPVVYSNNPIYTTALGVQQAPWYERNAEDDFYLDAGMFKQATARIQIKAGISGEYYDVSARSTRYVQQLGHGLDSLYTYSRFTDDFHRFPYYVSSFIQTRLDFPLLRAEIGARFSYFTPQTMQTTINGTGEGDPVQQNRLGKYFLSPRLAFSFPITKVDQLFMNYGQFLEIPPLYYLYAYTSTDPKQAPLWPIYGNPDLKPSRSTAYEISYNHTMGVGSYFSLTMFYRKYKDLLDSKIANPLPGLEIQNLPTRYINRASSNSRGLEFEINHSFSPKLHTQFVYNYVRTIGTANSPEDNYYSLLNSGNLTNLGEKSLNWEQRHSFILSARWAVSKSLKMTAISRLYGPHNWLNSSPIAQRVENIPWRNIFDLRLFYNWQAGHNTITPYIEARNLFNHTNKEYEENYFLINNQPLKPFEEEQGRRFRFGFQIN